MVVCKDPGFVAVGQAPEVVAIVVGKRLPPLQSNTIGWSRDWVTVIAALHHAIDKVETPSLDGIRHHHPDRQTDLTNHHLISFLLLSVVS